jgi:magnesium chelatase family protein
MTLKTGRDGRADILPAASPAEAALEREAVVDPARSLLDVCAHLAGWDALPRHIAAREATTSAQYPDLDPVRGQPEARRALEIAAARRHSLLIL